MASRTIDDPAAEQKAWERLQFYTLAHGDPAFIHQHAVDAWTAQQADARHPPIALAFALIGLYLHLERGFSGRQVQRVHMLLGKRHQQWPEFELPGERGAVAVTDVMAVAAGPGRDRAIDQWCASVWDAFSASRQAVVGLLAEHGII